MSNLNKIISDFLGQLHNNQLSNLYIYLFEKELERGFNDWIEYKFKLEEELKNEFLKVLKPYKE